MPVREFLIELIQVERLNLNVDCSSQSGFWLGQEGKTKVSTSTLLLALPVFGYSGVSCLELPLSSFLSSVEQDTKLGAQTNPDFLTLSDIFHCSATCNGHTI